MHQLIVHTWDHLLDTSLTATQIAPPALLTKSKGTFRRADFSRLHPPTIVGEQNSLSQLAQLTARQHELVESDGGRKVILARTGKLKRDA